MTIFIKAAKALILECLDKSMEEAVLANNGFFGGWRNHDLSNDQKKLTIKLKKLIEEFTSKSEDEKDILQLKQIVLDIDSEVEKNRREVYKEERGKLNATLTKINSNLDRFYEVLKKLPFKLIDVNDDHDPFRILCACSAYYFGQDIFLPQEQGFLSKTFTLVGGTSSIEIRQKKESCLIEHLVKCDEKLQALKDGYDDMRREMVLLEIDSIQKKNASICINSQISKSIPVSVSIFATANISTPIIKPSRGRLEDAMQEAISEIKKSIKSEQNKDLKINEITHKVNELTINKEINKEISKEVKKEISKELNNVEEFKSVKEEELEQEEDKNLKLEESTFVNN